MYPVMLNLEGKKILIVGGGRIAKRKVNGLHGEGAFITVMAPEIDVEIASMDVECIPYPFTKQDISHYDIVFIATNDEGVNKQVMECVNDNQLVNDCSNKSNSNFFNVASFKHDDMRIMISSDGASPEKSKVLKQKIKDLLK
ncbi:bifunctional precorrin-2 dehydrogenase/sirohydrochlorin ferrochelatase [Macrococcoides goetzii]|uniref:precorrin-2 dehydrogenase/sirohydrochlorin ferrochelatase family protein n=1 Tax=Macrococcus TaxID=69965 RepID=UPI001EF39E04|nr:MULTISPECIES: bifunctional precorrin-2 dehydrogenase/sirohydrochlorin ferrochelatase [Macrococcus]MCG7419689.1 bifunctional precorrin-2 dehydrogenase/sirohydrochlorin ferrochelatase [Macrococcus epidermidis]MCH4984042.1 bifunctional precorrin-2 dehydrogenase/sirohydrochlorin ferrochelatase [Macrococcus sp. PK]